MGGDAVDGLGTILGVWAHPDDETYLSAGLMADAARRGSRVYCVTATRGEGGSMDEERWPPAAMGEVREKELLRSFEILGVTEHEFLGLPDIDMDTPLPESGAARVRELMADVRPNTVLTFGPDGMTGHVAHMSASRWATDAFRSSAPPGARLFYAAYTQEWADEFVPEMNKFDVFRPGTPPVVARAELAISFVLPPELLELKLRAIEEHVSQVEGMVEAFGEGFFRRAMAEESFRLAEERP
jgi:LmbE family N-acetylglucosaminyl deacetylase